MECVVLGEGVGDPGRIVGLGSCFKHETSRVRSLPLHRVVLMAMIQYFYLWLKGRFV